MLPRLHSERQVSVTICLNLQPPLRVNPGGDAANIVRLTVAFEDANVGPSEQMERRICSIVDA